ncbi:MAG: DUF167 domain-containing protein [Fibrobacteraceae bacterium]|jgi:uncharacterized protein (TIGR00251 family)|nr:DUF167 domain-containing protein [Fibrobacteraceae bacterium]MBQ5610158.1 DUF167 domain-containing protein [Fibrobacteraceae bacterium]MEE1276712.1 DUF167 domain-containing protein [Fibrobacteraceae bacterium]
MRIQVKAHARSRRESVVKQADGSFKVDVKAPPSDGEANAAICKLLAEYFHKPKSAVRVILGGTNSKKVIEIDD